MTAAAGRPGRCWPPRTGPRSWRARRGWSSPARARSSRPPRRSTPEPPVWSGRAVPGVPPRHLHLAGPDEAGQPAQRAPAARGRAVGDDRRRARGAPYPYDELERCWHTVLLQQFHDILPGSSIALGAPRGRARVRRGRAARWRTIIEHACRALAGTGSHDAGLNAGPFADGGGARRWAPACRWRAADGDARRLDRDGDRAGERPRPGGRRRARAARPRCSTWRADREAAARRRGRRTCCSCTATPRPSGTPGTSTSTTGGHVVDLTAVECDRDLETGPERVAVRVTRRFGDSAVEQVISLRGGRARSTSRRHRLARAAEAAQARLPARRARRPAPPPRSSSAMSTARPTPTRPGTPPASRLRPPLGARRRGRATASRWPTTRPTGTTSPTVAAEADGRHDVRLSLLRAPLFPDPEADQGEHTLRVLAAARRERSPMRSRGLPAQPAAAGGRTARTPSSRW